MTDFKAGNGLNVRKNKLGEFEVWADVEEGEFGPLWTVPDVVLKAINEFDYETDPDQLVPIEMPRPTLTQLLGYLVGGWIYRSDQYAKLLQSQRARKKFSLEAARAELAAGLTYEAQLLKVESRRRLRDVEFDQLIR